ncbi:hypothetical protein MJO28_006924 [Puccinia striiformis f. sp. tritici]|uniref:Uncharacterized protein n=1 Tax=Puccinia striiformis f. sp. tritici TaxID=168172 RepID=A0ACC0ED08_9BASI|nr:hypothetical protein MJO28_006924 [Puccinia striiformis f. sp. tritici]
MDKQQLKRKSPAEEKEEEEDNIKKIKTGHHHQTSKSVVELDKSRASLNIKQKPIELCEVSNQIKKNLVAVTEELESTAESINQLSSTQNILIACLVHESDQTIAELTKYVHSKLLPQTKLLIDEDEDQELKKPFDPLPLSVIESSINQVAKRVNYAPVQADLDWLPSNLPKGFQIWRWECKDLDGSIPSDLKDISQKRWAERQLIKPQLLSILSNLEPSEKETLLKKLNPNKRKSKNTNTDNDDTNKPKPLNLSQQRDSKKSSTQNSPIKTPKLKSSASSSQTGKESEDKVLTDKEIIKQQKEQKRKEKEELKLAEQRQKQKMGNLISGWMSKSTPSSTNKKLASSSNQTPKTMTDPQQEGIEITAFFKNGVKQPSLKSQCSDFEKTFKAFNRKPNVQLAPINRFRPPSSETGSNIEKFTTDLSPQECLDQYLKSVRPTSTINGSSTKPMKMMTIREIVNGIAEAELTGSVDDTKKWRKTLQNRNLIQVKFLRFYEDVRPGYIGTWCKTSRLVSGRNPFGRETCLLDYDYDSEADWNEEDVEGEDLEQQSDGGQDEEGGEGMSSDLGDSGDEDGWLVGDDDEIEVVDDSENHAHNRALDVNTDQLDHHQLGKQNKINIKGPTRRKIVGPLIPLVKGPIWEDSLGILSNPIFESFRIQMINDAPIGLNPFTYQPTLIHKIINRPKLSTIGMKSGPLVLPLPCDQETETQPPLNKLNINEPIETENQPHHHHQINNGTGKFPIDLIPSLIQHVNGNRKPKPILLEDLKNLFANDHHRKVSKRSIEIFLPNVAVKVAGTWRIVDDGKTVKPTDSSSS